MPAEAMPLNLRCKSALFTRAYAAKSVGFLDARGFDRCIRAYADSSWMYTSPERVRREVDRWVQANMTPARPAARSARR